MVSRHVPIAIWMAMLVWGCSRGSTEPGASGGEQHVWAASIVAKDTANLYRDFNFWIISGIPLNVWPRVWIEDVEMPRFSMTFSSEGFLVGYMMNYPTLVPLDSVTMKIRMLVETGDSIDDSASVFIPPVPHPVAVSDSSGLTIVWNHSSHARENYVAAHVYCEDSTGSYDEDTFAFVPDTSFFFPDSWLCPFDEPIYREVTIDVAYIGAPWKGEGGNFRIVSGRYIPISFNTLEMSDASYGIHMVSPDVSKAREIFERVLDRWNRR